ncbi:MAG: hypothetical protein PHH11_17750 [Methylomonas sp.]|nr:hypothetical protein [Methylomonas sp.]
MARTVSSNTQIGSFTAQKDAHKLAAARLKDKALQLLAILKNDPFQNPPPYEKLV